MQTIATENKLFTIMPPTPSKRKLVHAQHRDANVIAGFGDAPVIVHRLHTWLCTARREQSPANKAVFAIRRSGSRFGVLLRARSSFCQICVVATSGQWLGTSWPAKCCPAAKEQDTMAQTNIAAQNPPDQGAAARQTPKDLHSSARPSPQGRPPVANDGLETVRSNDC
jgi:hypothetical protein